MKLNRFLPILLAFILVFSFVPNLASAAVSTATIEKLVKSAETQSNTLVKQMSSSNAKSIKLISPKTTSTLSSTISKAKATLKGFKGKQKATFEKRLKAAEQTLVQVKIYNTTITNGTTLTNQLSTFKKSFASQPFQTEKLRTSLKAKNDQFTKELGKLAYKNARIAFSAKFQTEVKKELDSKKEFFELNKRIVSFIKYTESNVPDDVWAEFHFITANIAAETELDEKSRKLLSEKWYGTYYPVLINPEETNITNYLNKFVEAMNNRDATALVELYPLEDGEMKQSMIEFYNGFFSTMPTDYSIKINKLDIEFVFKDQAAVVVEVTETYQGEVSTVTTTFFLVKEEGFWMITDGPNGEE